MVIETIRVAHRENPQLRLGCLKGYSGRVFQQAAEQHPEVTIHVINGTHKELFITSRVWTKDMGYDATRRALLRRYQVAHEARALFIEGRESMFKSEVLTEITLWEPDGLSGSFYTL